MEKKKVKYILLAVAAIAASVVNIIDDEDEGVLPVEIPSTENSSSITYHIGDMGDISQLVDVTAVYTDKNGEIRIDTLSGFPWEKSLEEVRTPFSAHLEVHCKAKKDVSYNKEYYRYTKDIQIISHNSLPVSAIPTDTIKRKDIGVFITELESNPYIQNIQIP